MITAAGLQADNEHRLLLIQFQPELLTEKRETNYGLLELHRLFHIARVHCGALAVLEDLHHAIEIAKPARALFPARPDEQFAEIRVVIDQRDEGVAQTRL